MRRTLNPNWPVLREYDQAHLARIALPLGGIGTGTVSLGGRGDLRDWEITNRPAKGFVPDYGRGAAPFFALYTRTQDGHTVTRALEGPIEVSDYEGGSGCDVANHGLPRFSTCTFAAAYPLAQVMLSDPGVPVTVRLEAFNPLVPADADKSGIPAAVLRYVLTNRTGKPVTASVCGTVPNCADAGSKPQGKPTTHRNRFRQGRRVRGIFMDNPGGDPHAETAGTLALTTTARDSLSYRTAWAQSKWAHGLLDFWDDFGDDGMLDPRKAGGANLPMASLAVKIRIPPRAQRSITFLLTWRFPNRTTWTPGKTERYCREDNIGNYYATRYRDAWHVAEELAANLPRLERETCTFVRAFCESDLPDSVKEAALFNLSTLRTETCFRTPDGRLYGWEGCCDRAGCCHGSCTHVWNYEQATAFLFGDLARTMRDVEFAHATAGNGLMSFRVGLPLTRARDFGKAAADGQMGCIMKMYRDWQLSGDDAMLKTLWPKVKKALAFCWIEGGWDADRDGVMEGCQHNTMDVEYYGPNPQMGTWYLGALRAAEEMARYLHDDRFADTCRDLFLRGSRWMDANLFNGEYYEHHVRPPRSENAVSKSLRLSMGAEKGVRPDYQLGAGCLVDQLVGQFMAHICGLGYLLDRTNVRKALRAVMKYNHRKSVRAHFNNMRSYVLNGESALLMAAYPKGRPRQPFPYFTEVMTGFEYTAAVGMLYEGQTANGLTCIRGIRDRYDGRKRSPFNEAECGHHYARAMASWAAVPALTGFHYSGVTKTMTFAARDGLHFWSNGTAWGTCRIRKTRVDLEVLHGRLKLKRFVLTDTGEITLPRVRIVRPGRGKTLRL